MELRVGFDGRSLPCGRRASELGCKWFDCTRTVRAEPWAAGLSYVQRAGDYAIRRYACASALNEPAGSCINKLPRKHIRHWFRRRATKLVTRHCARHVSCKLPDVEQYVPYLNITPSPLTLCGYVVTVNLTANTNIQYKYIRKFNGQVTWESDPNNEFTTPAGGSYTLNDVWR